VALLVLAAGLYFSRLSGTDPRVYSNDFNVFYHAATEVLSGRDPYQSSLGDWTPYLYPPLLAELLIPLAVLPLKLAAYLWFVINAFALGAAAWLSAILVAESVGGLRAKDGAERRSFLISSLVALGSTLVLCRFALDNFSLGQVNPLVAFFCVGHVYLYSKGRRTASAFLFALAAAIKLTPMVFIVWHLARKRIKFATACAGLLAAVTLLSFLPLGARAPDAWNTFLSRTIRNEQGFNYAYAGNQSLRGLIERAEGGAGVSESSRAPASLPAAIASLALILLAVFVAARTGDETGSAAPFFCLLVVLSPLSWKAHFVSLIFPISYLMTRAVRAQQSWLGWLAALSLFASFMLFNLTSPTVIGLPAAEWSDSHSLVLGGALITFIACIVELTSRREWLPYRSSL
jgi:alpha-1,2-mannosyltransferase